MKQDIFGRMCFAKTIFEFIGDLPCVTEQPEVILSRFTNPDRARMILERRLVHPVISRSDDVMTSRKHLHGLDEHLVDVLVAEVVSGCLCILMEEEYIHDDDPFFMVYDEPILGDPISDSAFYGGH